MIDIVVLGHKQGIRVFWALIGPLSLSTTSLFPQHEQRPHQSFETFETS